MRQIKAGFILVAMLLMAAHAHAAENEPRGAPVAAGNPGIGTV